MRARIIYPMRTGFHLEEHWPVEVGDVRVSFGVEDNLVVSITCEWPLRSDDRPPELLPLEEGRTGFGGVDFALKSRDRIDDLLRTTQGLLSLHGVVDIDFDRPSLTWIPETPDEDLGLDLILNADPHKPELFEPERIDFRLIARSMAAAPAATALEVALSFFRRGRRDFRERRFIEAFYNHFFFLETQFAAGLSDPKKVLKRLRDAPAIRRAIDLARHDPPDPPVGFVTEVDIRHWEERTALLGQPDETILADLVKLRGDLHHHAMRKPGAWHPDKGGPFRAASHVLRDIAAGVADGIYGDIVLAPEHDEAMMRSADAAGATTTFAVSARGIFHGGGAMRLSMSIRVPGTLPSREMVAEADLGFRRWLLLHEPESTVFEYEISVRGSDRVLARYVRPAFTPTR